MSGWLEIPENLDELDDVDLDATPVENVTVGLVLDGGTWKRGTLAPTDRVWMPLTTVVGGEPELVWDDDDSLIPTEVPI